MGGVCMILIDLISYLKDNPIFSATIAFVFTFFIWLYKENKELITKTNNAKISELESNLKELCLAESKIAFYTQNSNSYVYDKEIFFDLGRLAPYCCNEIRILIEDYYKLPNSDKLKTMLSFLQIEIKRIRQTKEKYDSENNTSDPILFFSKILKPAIPIILLVFAIIITLIAASFEINGKSSYFIANFISIVCAICFSSVLYYVLVKAIVEKGFNEIDKKWKIEIIIMILSPILLIISINFGIVSLGIQFATLLISIISYKRSKIVIYK